MVEEGETGDFEKAESGASGLFQKQAGHIKRGDYAMLKNQPCKIMEQSTAKAGKHGAAKASLMGINIFTNKKVEDTSPSTHNMDCPTVNKNDFTLVNIQDDGFLELLQDDGTIKADLKLPDDEDFAESKARIIEEFKNDREIQITVISAIGQEKVVDFHINK